MNKAGKCGEKFNTSQTKVFLRFMSHWQRITEPAQEHGCAARSSVLKKDIFAAEEKSKQCFRNESESVVLAKLALTVHIKISSGLNSSPCVPNNIHIYSSIC